MLRFSVVRQALITALLFLGCILGLQATYLAVQLGSLLHSAEQELRATTREAQATLVYSQAVLASVRGTTETVRKSAVQQMGYYEAMGRRSATALARLELLLTHSDARLERIAQSIEESIEATSGRAGQSIGEIGLLAGAARDEMHALSVSGRELAGVSTEAVALLNRRLADDRLDQIAGSLARSSESAAVASANVAEATGYIRDILSPGKKSFWRRLLDLLVPRPAANVK